MVLKTAGSVILDPQHCFFPLRLKKCLIITLYTVFFLKIFLYILCKGGRAGEEAGELHHRYSAETAPAGHYAAGPGEAQETGGEGRTNTDASVS